MPERYGFDKQSVERISRAVKGYEKNADPSQQEGIVDNNNPSIVKTPAGGILARVAGKVAKAECTRYFIDKDTGDLIEGSKVDVWNLSEASVAGDSFIMPHKDKRGSLVVHNGTALNGMIRVTFTDDFISTSVNVQCHVWKTDSGVTGSITAYNSMDMSGDSNGTGYVWQWADGTYDLIAAQCPAS